jgi:iron only hydrogenase large subunit-like protein
MKEGYTQFDMDLVMKIMKASESTSPVELSFGYVKDGHCYQGVVIKSAPQKVLDVINKTETICMLEKDGLHIVIAKTSPRED